VRSVATATVVLLGATLSACSEDETPDPAAASASSAAQDTTSELELTCTGTGAPTVVLEMGLGEDASAWDEFTPLLTDHLRVCTSSRSGLGLSPPLGPDDPDPSAGSAAEQLHAALAAAGERPPYVVLGFSYGGMVAQAFAGEYPDDLAGLVLEDSAAPGEFTDPPWRRLEIDWSEGGRPIDQDATAAQLGGLDLGAIPLFVLTQDQLPPDLDRLWTGYHEEQAALSTQSLHVRARGSPHFIHEDRPDLVVAAIDEVVAAADGSLASCDQRFDRLGGTCL
jgi:pimeloyl-ACP methyl ester carboxylesterase